MPQPIWSHAADCVTDMIHRDMFLTPEQDLATRSYMIRVPVRCVLDLMMTLNLTDRSMADTLLVDDSTEIREAFTGMTAHVDHHLVILNNIRILFGWDSWFPSNSPMVDNAERYFQFTKDIEEHVGFDPDTRSSLYTMLTNFSDSEEDCDSDDDTDSTITTNTNQPDAGSGDADAGSGDADAGSGDGDDDGSSVHSASTSTTIGIELDLGAFLEMVEMIRIGQ